MVMPRFGYFSVSRDYVIELPCDITECTFNSILSKQCSCPSSIKITKQGCSLWLQYKEKK